MHIESISYHNPYYNVELMTDHKRATRPYQYDQDQDGRFFIRCSSCDDLRIRSGLLYRAFRFGLRSVP
ncbi:MAG: hypothetical protein ACLUIE_13985 [Parabacteroides merdae]